MAPTGADGRSPPEVVRHGSAKGGWLRRTGLSHLVGILALAFSIFPILFVVSASLNPTGTLSSSTLIPREVSLVNYQELFDGSFPRWFVNSLVIASLAAAISMLISACAAYAFSRFRFKGRRTGLMSLLLVQMFPQFLAIVAIYLIFAEITELWPVIGFNTSAGLILLYLGGALGREHLADEGLLRHHPQGPRRVGQDGRGDALPGLLRHHPPARGADPGHHRPARLHRGDQRVPDRQHLPAGGPSPRPRPSASTG